MKPLTEDDFVKTIMIGKKPIIEINAETMVFVELRERILKNQELAKNINEADFKLVTERDFGLMIKIIDRLKKEIENYKSIGKTGEDNYDEETGDVINLLQKILLGKEEELTPKELSSDEEAES